MEIIKTPKLEGVRMLNRLNPKKSSSGTLYLTATTLIFVDPDGKKETWILHMHIASVEKLPLTQMGSPLHIRCKTFLIVTFVIPKDRDCHDVYTALLQLSQPVNMEDLYCFHSTAENDVESQKEGWKFFDLQSEYQRMGAPNNNWCLTTINKDYDICDTYPRYIYVPSTVTTPILVSSSRFRSKGRLPVLTYLHKNQAAICRCSQPLSGFSARCVEDELMLNCILKANPNSNFMYVVDTRPRINAMANRAAGKGYENENFYENIKFHFLGIENIHTMRSGLAKLIETCEMKVPSMSAFLSGVESSGWLKHIKAIMDTAVFIANAVTDGVTVLVHCSDGWDRTAQTCSLASLILDPHYRTLHGFQDLIEKEWLAFGHKFTDRCGHLQGDPKEVSPVFTQFVESVWQMLQQFPQAFQFTERYLLLLHDHVYSCQYGTFVGNCEKDRLDLRLQERTNSLWGYVTAHSHEYINPLYDNSEPASDLLLPNTSPQHIRFWRGLYCRFEGGVHPREPLIDMLIAMKDHSSSLEDHLKLVEKRLELFKGVLGRSAETPCKDEDSVMNDSCESELLRLKDTTPDSASNRHSHISDYESGFEDGKTDQNSPSSTGDANNFQSNGEGNKLVLDVRPTSSIMFTFEQLMKELCSVAIDWKNVRNIKECVCSTPFDHFSRKYHCWKCGEVFCMRCIDKHTSLPGHQSGRMVPVCRPCYKDLVRSLSVDTP